MKMKYALLNAVPVFLMEKVKPQNGEIAVQSLTTGETGFVKPELLTDMTEDYDEIMQKWNRLKWVTLK